MLMTFTPRLAMCTIARASELISPARRTSCGLSTNCGSAYPNVCADCRIDTSVASGAIPINPSGPPPGGGVAGNGTAGPTAGPQAGTSGGGPSGGGGGGGGGGGATVAVAVTVTVGGGGGGGIGAG